MTTATITPEEYREYTRTGQLPPHIAALPTAADRLAERSREKNRREHGAAPAAHRFAGLARGQVSTRGRMNVSETKWSEVLESLRTAGHVTAWWFEPMRLRITDPAPGQRAVYFTADFLVQRVDGVVLVDDVKGGMVNDASIVRIKAAATKFPLWQFRLVKKVAKKRGEWEITEL